MLHIAQNMTRSPKEIITLEYGKFRSEHPLWSFIRWLGWYDHMRIMMRMMMVKMILIMISSGRMSSVVGSRWIIHYSLRSDLLRNSAFSIHSNNKALPLFGCSSSFRMVTSPFIYQIWHFLKAFPPKNSHQNAELQKRKKLAPTIFFTQKISTKTRDLRHFQIRDKIA